MYVVQHISFFLPLGLVNPLLQASFLEQQDLSKENKAAQHLGDPSTFFIKDEDEDKVDSPESV